MSYILEALKKAQAERQLGSAPTLHAPTLQSVDRSSAGARFKKPLVLVIIAMGVVIAALGALVLRPSARPVTAVEASGAPAVVRMPAPAPAAQPALAPQAAPVQVQVQAQAQAQAQAQIAAPATESAPLPEPVAALPPPVATLAPATRNRAEQQTAHNAQAGQTASTLPAAQSAQPGQNAQAGPAAQASKAAQAAQAPQTPQTAQPAANGAAAKTAAGAPAKSAFEEPVQNLRDLPEPIQRSIPQVAVGGYIYSKNPADRLLLIDKVLRREGEEVAPGLLLEKLLPKEAVFNFKGYRYRVPY